MSPPTKFLKHLACLPCCFALLLLFVSGQANSADDKTNSDVAKVVDAIRKRFVNVPNCQFSYTNSTKSSAELGRFERHMEFVHWNGKFSFREKDAKGGDLSHWTFDGENYYGYVKANSTVYVGSDPKRIGLHLLGRFRENPLFRPYAYLAGSSYLSFCLPNISRSNFWAQPLVESAVKLPTTDADPLVVVTQCGGEVYHETSLIGVGLLPSFTAVRSVKTNEVVQECRVTKWEAFRSAANVEVSIPSEVVDVTTGPGPKDETSVSLVPGSFKFLESEPLISEFRIPRARAPKLYDDDLRAEIKK